MADRIVIEGIDPYDGEYEFDHSYILNRELHTIKRLSGVRMGELFDAIISEDTDVILALAVIALERAGKTVVEDVLWEAKAGSIKYLGERAGVADPPQKAAEMSGGENETSESGTSSGDGSSNDSARLASVPNPTGTPESDTPADSAQAI